MCALWQAAQVMCDACGWPCDDMTQLRVLASRCWSLTRDRLAATDLLLVDPATLGGIISLPTDAIGPLQGRK